MSGLMSIGKSAMFASYAQLQTASNNIANANTPGYSRQQVQLADADGQYTGAGFFGKGVKVTTVSRSYDQFLTNQAVGSASASAADAARSDQLTQLENVFPIGSAGVGAAAGNFLNAFVDLGNTPSDSSARQVVLSQANELSARFQAAGDQLSQLQTGLTQDVTAQVASVNTMAAQVAKLNLQITTAASQGQPPNQLLDQRDHLVSQIAAIVNVTSVTAGDGSVGLFIGGGQTLVLGANTTTLKASRDTFDPAKVMLTVNENGVDRPVPASSLSGGSLAGLLKFQNEDLTQANNLLGQLAVAVSGAVNAQQSLGLDLSATPQRGAPVFSVGTPRVLAAADNSGSAAVSVTVDDASKVQASDYALRFDGSNYSLVRSSDQSVAAGSPYTPAQLAAGVQVDGMTVQLTGGTANADDRFVLQPVATAAQTMQTVLANPKGIAAASPFAGSVGANNTGTATLRSLVAADPSYNGALSASVTFTSDTGAYAWSLSDGTSGTGTWTAGTPIALNGFALSLDGVPKSGDTLSVAPTTSVASNNGNALAFAGLLDQRLVGQNANGSAGATITDAYAGAIADIGVRVQGGKTAATLSSAAASDAETSRANQAGVNLDEEAAKLIQFQQSYQAAAKILQVAQSLFQTLLQTAGG